MARKGQDNTCHLSGKVISGFTGLSSEHVNPICVYRELWVTELVDLLGPGLMDVSCGEFGDSMINPGSW